MGWTFSLDDVDLNEDDLTAGQLEHLFLMVNSEIAHPEMTIGAGLFGHCPVCRVAIGTLALEAAGIPTDIAVSTVRSVSALALGEAFVPPAIRRAADEVTT